VTEETENDVEKYFKENLYSFIRKAVQSTQNLFGSLLSRSKLVQFFLMKIH